MFAASKTAGAVSAAPPASSDSQFNYVSLLLNDTGTNGQQNNTFVDSSTNNFTITRNGTPTQGSFSPYGDLWSNNFSGSGQYLTTATASPLQFGTGDFTIEFWMYLVARDTLGACIFANYNSFTTGALSFFAGHNTGSTTKYQVACNGTFPAIQSTATVTYNQWDHFAVVRSGSTLTLYVNGVANGTFNVSGVSLNGVGSNWIFGAALDALTNYELNGYISNLRVVKGTALYTSNFTPSTTPLTAVSGTSLLTCQSNRFRDNSSNNFAITVTGTPSVQRFSPFDPAAEYSTSVIGGSGQLPGVNTSFLSIPQNTAFDFGAGDFTVEAWVYPTVTTQQAVVGKWTGVGQVAWIAQINPGSSNIQFAYGNAGVFSANVTFSGTIRSNSWSHIAFTRSGTSVRAFINGVQAGTTQTIAAVMTATNANLVVGKVESDNNNAFNGYLTDVRVVKGTAVYTADFTPPTAPVTAITGTSLLLNCTNAGIYDAATLNDLVTVGNAQVSTAQAKFGSSSMAFDGTEDYLQSVPSTLYDFGTGDFTIECWFYIAGNSALNNNGTRDGCVFGLSSGASLAGSLIILGNSTTTGTGLQLFKSTNTVTNVSATVSISQNAWHHVAATKSGTSVRLFLDGSQVGTTVTSSTIWGSSTFTPYVGANQATGYVDHFNGYIEDIRITKGYARYTANFTPPTAPFPTR